MPDALRQRLENKVALHSAAAAYGPNGTYGEKDQGNDRSMKILFSERANKSEPHPIIAKHPESGAETIFGTVGYIHTILGLKRRQPPIDSGFIRLADARRISVYPRLEPNMLVMWDNRSVLHKANGGYDGHARELQADYRRGSCAGPVVA